MHPAVVVAEEQPAAVERERALDRARRPGSASARRRRSRAARRPCRPRCRSRACRGRSSGEDSDAAGELARPLRAAGRRRRPRRRGRRGCPCRAAGGRRRRSRRVGGRRRGEVAELALPAHLAGAAADAVQRGVVLQQEELARRQRPAGTRAGSCRARAQVDVNGGRSGRSAAGSSCAPSCSRRSATSKASSAGWPFVPARAAAAVAGCSPRASNSTSGVRDVARLAR